MPPEMSFGRSVRYRRTKLGLSQTRLGELVGRSAAAVRSWERDTSVPSDPSVLEALSAVLGIEKEVLFAKAGMETPVVESSPTVEEALGSLAPASQVRETESAEVSTIPTPPPDAEQSRRSYREDPSNDMVSVPYTPIPPSGDMTPGSATPAYSSSVDPFVLTVPAPPVLEPSYMEDETQRRMYRIRNLATLVLGLALVVMMFWALGHGWDELMGWWDDFLGQLRL